MTFYLDTTPYTLPDDPGDISIQTIREWSTAYGHPLSLSVMAARAQQDPDMVKLRLQLLFMEQVTSALSFFTTPTLDPALVRSSMDLDTVITLLGESGIALAIQGPQMPLPPLPLTVPAVMPVDGVDYVLVSPIDSVNMETLTHAQFLLQLQLAQYMLELAEGDWTNFHALCAGYVRIPEEALSAELINPEGTRADKFRTMMHMDAGAPLAQYFIGAAASMVTILDSYTTRLLTPAEA